MKRPEIRRPEAGKRPEPAKRPGPAPSGALHRPSTPAPRPGSGGSASIQPRNLDPGHDILEVIELLAEIIDTENTALSEQRFKEATELQDRKAALSQLYERHMVAISQNPGLLEALPDDVREKLRKASERLKAGSEINIRLLKSNMMAIETVLGSVVAAIRETSTPINNYSAKGAAEESLSIPSANSISLNDIF